MKKNTKLLSGILLIVAILTLSSCEKKSNESKNSTKIRVSYFPSAIYDSLVELADAKGWFKEANLDVETISFTNGPAVNDAILSGDLDIGYAVGDQPFIAQATREPDAVIISEASLQFKNLGLAGSEEIKKVSDLKGKRIAVQIGTMYHKQLLAILNDNGLSESDVELVNLAVNESYTALANGEISGIEYGNAWSLKQIENLGGHKLQDSEVSPGRAVTYTTRKFAENHKKEIIEFLKVLYKAEDYIQQYPEDSYKTIADYLNIYEEQVRIVNTNNIWTTGISKELVPHLENTYKFLKDRNYISAQIDDFSKFIDSSYVEEAYNEYKKNKQD